MRHNFGKLESVALSLSCPWVIPCLHWRTCRHSWWRLLGKLL